MYNFNEEERRILANRDNSEFYYVVHVIWPDGEDAIYGQYVEPGVQPLLLSVTDFSMQGREDGAGVTGAITVKLNDAFGIFRHKFDHFNLHNTPAGLYLKEYNHPNFSLGLYHGRIRNPIKWSEGERTIEFEINAALTHEQVGYTPDMADIQVSSDFTIFQEQTTDNWIEPCPTTTFLSSSFFKLKQELNTSPWPNIFGYAYNVPVEPLAKSPTVKTRKDVFDITGGSGLLLDLQLKEGEALRNNAIRTQILDEQEHGDSLTTPVPDEQVKITYAQALTVGCQKNQYIDPTLDPNPDPDGLNPNPLYVPRPTGLINIPVHGAEGFDSFTLLPLELSWDGMYVICKGTFYNRLLDGVHGPFLQVAIENFNIPIYTDLYVFSDPTTDMVIPDYVINWPVPLTFDEKQDIIARSLAAQALEHAPDYLNYETEPLKDSLLGYGTEEYTKFYIYGYKDKSDPLVFPVDAPLVEIQDGNYPWLKYSWIEVEVPVLEVLAAKSSDITLNLEPNSSADEIHWNGETGYAFLQVIEQRGFCCTVHNPKKIQFERIIAVYKNNIFQYRTEQLAISADTLSAKEPGYKRGVIPTGAEIKLFNWQPEQQYVVDCKPGTEVLAALYSECEDKYFAIPIGSYTVSSKQEGTLWQGYHPACSVLTLSYNGMIRRRYATNDLKLLMWVRNPYSTDEEIAWGLIDQVNAQPYNYQMLSLGRSESPKLSRKNFYSVPQGGKLMEILSNLAFQNGKYVRNYGNIIELVDFMNERQHVFEFKPEHIIAQTVKLGLTEEVTTLFNLEYINNNQMMHPIERMQKVNIPMYGTHPVTWRFNTCDTIAASQDVVDFWIKYKSNIWRTMNFVATFETLGIEVFDIVRVNVNQLLTFSKVYPQIVGPDTQNPESLTETPSNTLQGLPIYNTLAMVTSMQYNAEEGTIAYSLWLPIIAGETSQRLDLWRR